MKNQKGIKFLDASFNELLEIPRNTFPKLYELETINFSHNNLTQVVHDGGDYGDGVDGNGDVDCCGDGVLTWCGGGMAGIVVVVSR